MIIGLKLSSPGKRLMPYAAPAMAHVSARPGRTLGGQGNVTDGGRLGQRPGKRGRMTVG